MLVDERREAAGRRDGGQEALLDALTAEYLGESEESEEIFGEAFTALQTECAEFLGG